MFFMNKSVGNLSIKPYKSLEPTTINYPIKVLLNVKTLVVIGPSSIFDNFFSYFQNVGTLTFFGEIYFPLPESHNAEIYQMGKHGFLFFDKQTSNAYASRSLNILNEYCDKLGLNILQAIKSTNPNITVNPFFIHHDFNRDGKAENIDPEKQKILNLNWDENEYTHFPYKLIVETENLRTEDNPNFFKKQFGKAFNLADFEYCTLKSFPDDEQPKYFPEKKLDQHIILKNFINNSALDILVPNIMLQEDYQFMVNSAIENNRTDIVFSGLSSSGYGVQAFIEILPEGQRLPDYQAKINKLIIGPNPLIDETFLFRENPNTPVN